jgi:HSP20 family protein
MSHDKEIQVRETQPVAEAEAPMQAPAYDVSETENEFVITVQIPGVDRKDMETVIDGDDLVITGKRAWKQPESWKLLHEEIPSMDYRLVLRLDHRVNRNALKAHLRDGILTLMLPKAEEIKPRRIEIAS